VSTDKSTVKKLISGRMVMEYYLGKLGLGNSSEQAKRLRKIVLSGKTASEIISGFKEFIFSQKELYPDTVSMINRSLMAGPGSEYLGLGKDDFSLKSEIYKQLIDQFPEVYSFKFFCADCYLLADRSVNEIYPVLKEGMLQDKDNINYPTSDLFDLIHESDFSFDFDMLLLDKYYQPCEKALFDEWLDEFKERYKEPSEQDYLNQLKWKGNSNA
jgi:hypothetical protein